MRTRRIRYAPAAIDDLDAIFDYIAIENQDAALKMLSRFDQRIGSLAETPYLGAAISADEPGFIAEGYRYIAVPPYLIFYRVQGDEVRIGRILHSRRDWLHLLFQSGRKKPSEADRKVAEELLLSELQVGRDSLADGGLSVAEAFSGLPVEKEEQTKQ